MKWKYSLIKLQVLFLIEIEKKECFHYKLYHVQSKKEKYTYFETIHCIKCDWFKNNAS